MAIVTCRRDAPPPPLEAAETLVLLAVQPQWLVERGGGLVGGGWRVGNGEDSERVLVGSGDNSPSVFEVGERQCSH